MSQPRAEVPVEQRSFMRLLGCLGKTGPWVFGRIWKDLCGQVPSISTSVASFRWIILEIETMKNEWLVPWSLFGYCMILSLHGGFQVAWMLQSFSRVYVSWAKIPMILSANGFFPCMYIGGSLQNAPFQNFWSQLEVVKCFHLPSLWSVDDTLEDKICSPNSFRTPEIQWMDYPELPNPFQLLNLVLSLRYRAAPSVEVPTGLFEIGENDGSILGWLCLKQKVFVGFWWWKGCCMIIN